LNRREFLEASAAAALVAGCGGSDAGPDALHVSTTDVHAEDLNGALYRISRTGNAVSRVTSTGTAAWTTGGKGSAPAQFDFPTALAADNQGRVLVVDRGNSRVQIFEGMSGRYLGAFGSAGKGAGQFLIPRHIAASPDRIFVVAQLNHRVNVYDMNGNALAAIGATAGSGALDVPRGVAVDKDGNVYVSDSAARAVRKYTPTGAFAGRVDGGNVAHPHGLAMQANGDLWVADGASGRVVVLTPQGNVRQAIAIKLADGRPGAPTDVSLSGREIYVRATPMGS
jgi:DNA-binding beta-propeller fold protein YncE